MGKIKKILMVDDSRVALMMLKKCIPQNKGYEIIDAADGAEGIEKFKQYSPDITFMDLTMPVIDGFKATQKIIEIDPSAVVIALTADIQPKSLTRIKEIGAYTVIKKPARPELIEKALASVEMKLGSSGE